MKITELENFEEPSLKDIVNMNDDYLIVKQDLETKYWKTYHFLNLIYPLRTILNRYKYNTTNGSKCGGILQRMIDDELKIFYKEVLNSE